MTNRPFFFAIISCIASTVCPVHAETTFRLFTRNESIPENGVVTYTVLRANESEFTFLPPPQWKLEIDRKAGSLSWTSPDYRCLIQMQVNAGSSNRAPKLNSEELKKALLARHKQASILGEFPCYTSGLTGIAFDWERPGDSGLAIRSRSAFVPITDGTAELTFSTSRDQFEKRHMDLMRLLNSFRVTAPNPQLSEQRSQP